MTTSACPTPNLYTATTYSTNKLIEQHPVAVTACSHDNRLPSLKRNGNVKKGSPYSIAERRVPELIPVLGSQLASDVSHKPGGRLSLLSARPAVTPATLKRAATNFAAWRTKAQWV